MRMWGHEKRYLEEDMEKFSMPKQVSVNKNMEGKYKHV